ncbi:hypothetical protein [Segatella bryantii]|uniref:hypothetical protein n=1 Tax=Segatella bryantii TaxID=77095 RepID=UPI00242E1983|nr:hypothetical protein [Segatella bryantii]
MEKYLYTYLRGLSKSDLGTFGETLVLEKLKAMDFDVVNANTIQSNYESIDLFCTNPKNHQTIGIQVKTSFDTNIPIGMNLENCVREKLEKKILGPWVFVHIDKDGNIHCYILTREEMISLAHESNDWYVNKRKPSYRKNPVKLSNACGLYIRWIDGEGEEDNDRYYEFVNPLTEKAEDRWDKISNTLNRPSLYSKLEEFSGVVHIKDYSQKYVELQKQYSCIAEHVFFGGYFEVNNKRRIYPTDIEFYYHEEDADGLKDPIMYHTDDHDKKKLEYYPLSSLNFHISGLDVTFENKKKNYRASFLIREYKVCDLNGKDWVETKGNENRSTYIYEDMLMNIPLSEGINIRWIDSPSEKETSWEPVVSSRINVANYVTDTEGNYIKEEIDKNAFDHLSLEEQKKYFSYSGKKFKRCNRMWNFHK